MGRALGLQVRDREMAIIGNHWQSLAIIGNH
jgi:hypothetical protein